LGRHGDGRFFGPRRRFFPFIKFIFADAGYQGQKTAAAIAKTGTWKLTILRVLA
jgi:hypothetical protein